jgi:hypothetical protein
MTDEEIERERQEAERLMQRINQLVYEINYVINENNQLEHELDVSIRDVDTLIHNCGQLETEVYGDMNFISKEVIDLDITTNDVFEQLEELSNQYFIFKNLSTASKNVSQYYDEYYTRFSYYHDLRRITLGYVIGVDSNVINSEKLRKKVEKSYLENTDYWLAYCIASVMLWNSDEPEAAKRAVSKALRIDYYKSNLFFLIVNLRFNRIDAAMKWYHNYLDNSQLNQFGDEWQFLLQAYLSGAFGQDSDFNQKVAKLFKDLIFKIELHRADLSMRFVERAKDFANKFAHKTKENYPILKSVSSNYEDLIKSLSSAEKNQLLIEFFKKIKESDVDFNLDLPQRIENVLYSLINTYDEEEMKIIRNIKYNEAVISAKGDISIALKKFDNEFESANQSSDIGDLIVNWAFSENPSQVDYSVQKFSISLMKEKIVKGFEAFVSEYQKNEKKKISIKIDEYSFECDENSYEETSEKLAKEYESHKVSNILKDKFVALYSFLILGSIGIWIWMFFTFNSAFLTVSVIVFLLASFLLWRRIAEVIKILADKKRRGMGLLKKAIDEIDLWRKDYQKQNDISHSLYQLLQEF